MQAGGRAMSSFRPIISAVLMVSLPMMLGGCPLAIVGGIGAAGGAGYAANDERGVHGGIDDFAIKSNIQQAWTQANPLLQTLNITLSHPPPPPPPAPPPPPP